MIGSIIFVKTSSPISWIIRKLTKSEYSHVAVSISHDDSWIIEADVMKKVKPRKNRYSDYEVVDLCITDKQRLMLLETLLKQTDVEYDYVRIIGILFYLLRFTDNNNLWNDYNKTICNELISDGLKSIGYDLGDIITPADLANKLLGRTAICK